MIALFGALSISALAQITTLVSFDKTNGRDPGYPAASFAQAANGDLYGTTAAGGANDEGTVFKMTLAGKLVTLYSFCSQSSCADGAVANAGLVLATDGNFYGTTASGGITNAGTIFRITPAGKLTTIYKFCSVPGCADGWGPSAGLLQAADDNLYGTTVAGGASGNGAVFKITKAGALTTVASFNGANGSDPGFGSLIQASNGNFYGTTIAGGLNTGCGTSTGCGTVFRLTPGGQLTTVYSFCALTNCADGYVVYGGLVQGTDGNFYGTTARGGANSYGSIFQIATPGKLRTLFSFDWTDGAYPEAALIQGTDGNFYGTTTEGGSGSGTLFVITPAGSLTELYPFCLQMNCADGTGPFESLFQHTNGEFYGTTFAGGTSSNCIGGCGTAFSLSRGLAPFVKLLPASGKAGQTGEIIGQGFTGASGVFFNGTAASFTVAADTLIRATVPAGATTGFVTVATSTGTLQSNVVFHVRP